MPTDAHTINLTQAVIWTPPDLSAREQRAVDLLRREVEKRSLVRWPVASDLAADQPMILIGSIQSLQGLDHPAAQELLALGAPDAAEGYRIRVKADGGAPVVSIVGRDARGVLYGIGHLLRTLRMGRYSISLPAGLDVTTAPKYPLRGHQLGYRDKTNSYDGWDLPQWEQYICDLAVFGANAIEMIPPRSDDKPDSVHFPRPPLEMMAGVSRIADEYGIDIWL